MRNNLDRIASCFLSVFLSLFFVITPVFAFSNELYENDVLFVEPEPLTNEDGSPVIDKSITFKGIVDEKTVSGNASIVLLVHNIDTGDKFSVSLYDYNNYMYMGNVPEAGYYEIYKAFYNAKSVGIPENTFDVEYVRFYHPGDRNISINIVMGNPDNLNLDNIGDAYRINPPGEQYRDFRTNIASKNVSYIEYIQYGDVPLNESRNDVLPSESSTRTFFVDSVFEGESVDTSIENQGKNEFEYNEEKNNRFLYVAIFAVIIIIFGIVFYKKKSKK